MAVPKKKVSIRKKKEGIKIKGEVINKYIYYEKCGGKNLCEKKCILKCLIKRS
jgi:hypothetical protein